MAKSKRSKLVKVNVPELLCEKLLSERVPSPTGVLKKLKKTEPKPRGRGLTRVLENVSHEEWDELYQHAARIRATIKGCPRDAQLRTAICAKAMANRMEEAGVTDPVHYTIDKVKQKARQNTNRSIAEPITLDTVDQAEADDEELDRWWADINLGVN